MHTHTYVCTYTRIHTHLHNTNIHIHVINWCAYLYYNRIHCINAYTYINTYINTHNEISLKVAIKSQEAYKPSIQQMPAYQLELYYSS